MIAHSLRRNGAPLIAGSCRLDKGRPGAGRIENKKERMHKFLDLFMSRVPPWRFPARAEVQYLGLPA
jgi:hypothetical protein